MRKAGGGAIVNTQQARMTARSGSARTCQQVAVRGLTKTAALELARDNIRVNSIHPAMSSRRWWRVDAAAAGAGP